MITEYSQPLIANLKIIAQRFYTFAIYFFNFAFFNPCNLCQSVIKSCIENDLRQKSLKTTGDLWRPLALF